MGLNERRWAWAGWGAALVVWTYLLVSPTAAHSLGELVVPTARRFLAAKVGHFTGYAAFAFAVPFLTARPGVRLGVVAGLIAHGALTELVQLYVPGRTGELRDVVIDSAGVLTGLAAGRWLAGRRP
ncbi:MAG: VanZ family protein [Gemmataceae bacterium]